MFSETPMKAMVIERMTLVTEVSGTEPRRNMILAQHLKNCGRFTSRKFCVILETNGSLLTEIGLLILTNNR